MAEITIIMPSFNKEKYIKEALDSVFMQETSYNYSIIAADDHSTDGTIEIIKEYQNKYPDKITLLTSDVNQKLYKNVIRAYSLTKTEYFCVLDPDDFWIDRHKIQKALDFLEANKEYTIYVTDTLAQYPDGERKQFIKRKRVINSSFDDLLHKKAALGCTLGSVFRNVIFKNGLPGKMVNLPSDTAEQTFRGDAFRSILHLHEGLAHCEPYEDAVYRITEEGLWTGSSKFAQGLLTANLNKDVWLYYDKKYPEFLVKSYFAFNSIKDMFMEELSKDGGNNEKTLKQVLSLYKIYRENENLLKEHTKKQIPLRYLLRKYVYEKLYKRLQKKGYTFMS